MMEARGRATRDRMLRELTTAVETMTDSGNVTLQRTITYDSYGRPQQVDVLQDALPRLLGRSGNFEIVVFGILMVALLQFAREGVGPWFTRLMPTRRPERVPEVATLGARANVTAQGPLLELKQARKQFDGLVAVNDDFRDRVVLISVKRHRIVWQYGHTDVGGTARGYLHIPDGMDFLPFDVAMGIPAIRAIVTG